MRSHSKTTDEHEPLLSRTSSHNSSQSTKEYTKWLYFTTIAPKYKWIPLLGCSIIFINEAEYFIKQVATMRAIEAMYCYEYYLACDSPLVDLGKHIPERLCKDDSIQKNLARTAGLIMFVRMLCAMIGALPIGWFADRYGRKAVLVLHKINVTVSCTAWLVLYLGFPKVPIWTLYLSGTPALFAGNFDVGLAMLFASYTDVMPSATERASVFFLTTSMQYLAQTFCPTIGAWLMNLDGRGGTPQVNMTVSLILTIFTVLLTVFAFPETLYESKQTKQIDTESSEENDQDQAEEDSKAQSKRSFIVRSIQQPFKTFADSVSGIGAVNITLLSLSTCVAATGIKAIDWYGLIQYPVLKLHWTFPQASNIVSIQGLLMLLHFSLILPLLNRLAAAYLGSSGQGHFAIMAGSSTLLTAGSLIIGFSSTAPVFVTGVVVYLFGEGLPTATQAFIVSLLEKEKVARVMATLSMTSISGKLVASLLFPKMLAWGLDTHVDVLVGLPFFVSAGLFVVSSACFCVVGIRMWSGQKRDAEHGEE